MTALAIDSFALNTTHKGMLKPDIVTHLGVALEFPYTLIRGAQEGKTLLISAGVHGPEYASIEAALRLGELKPADITGTLVILPILNPPSYFARSIYVSPLDKKNLNRVFPGVATGTITERIAYWFSQNFLTQADAYIDMHGGDMNEALEPFTIYAEGDEKAQALAHIFGLRYVIGSSSQGMSVAAAKHSNIPAILVESGGQGLWPKEAVAPLVEGAKRVMRHMGMLKGENAALETQDVETFHWFSSEASGYWYAHAFAGTRVSQGQKLGEVKNLLGEVVQEVFSPSSGVVLFHVSSLAINTGDPLIALGEV